MDPEELHNMEFIGPEERVEEMEQISEELLAEGVTFDEIHLIIVFAINLKDLL